MRLKYGFVVKCIGADKDAAGNMIAVHCEYMPDSKSGTPGANNYKTKGVIHWVCANAAYAAEVRLYDRLFKAAYPGRFSKSYLDDLNPDALKVITGYLERSLRDAKDGERFQFERHGYFIADPKTETSSAIHFGRTVTLRDSWERPSTKSAGALSTLQPD